MTANRAAAVIAAIGAAFALVSGPVAGADTFLWVGGTRGPSVALPPEYVPTPLSEYAGGRFSDDTFVVIPYPSALWPVTGTTDPTLGHSVESGVANLTAEVLETEGPLVIGGVSQGSMVSDQVAMNLDPDPRVPTDTEFVVAGDPIRPGGLFSYLPAGTYLPILDYTILPQVNTRFPTTVITNEYDAVADFPDRPWNLVAVINSLAGAYYSHPNEGFADLSDAEITTVTNSRGGTTTTYLIRAKDLPLTQPLRDWGAPGKVVDAIDSVVRPIVDAGYSRNGTPGPYLKTGGGMGLEPLGSAADDQPQTAAESGDRERHQGTTPRSARKRSSR